MKSMRMNRGVESISVCLMKELKISVRIVGGEHKPLVLNLDSERLLEFLLTFHRYRGEEGVL